MLAVSDGSGMSSAQTIYALPWICKCLDRRSVEVNLRPGKPVLGVTSSSATSKVLTQTIGTCGGAVYDAAVALVDVLDKLTYPLTGSWDDKPACRPDQVSIINGYVCMYVCILIIYDDTMEE